MHRSIVLALVLAPALASCCFGSSAAPAPIAAAPVVAPPTVLDVGTPVLAAWHGGQFWFVGVVVGSEGPNVRVLYADGASEALPAASVTADRLGAGMAVDAHQYGETAFARASLLARVGHAARVRYADGRDMWVAIGHVRVDSPAGPPAGVDQAPIVAAATGMVGSPVLARFTDGYLYSAVVVDPGPSGAPRVVYADGSGQDTSADAIFPDTLVTGSPVEVRDRAAGATLSGTVVRRVLHAIEVRVADGSSRWFALADARIAAPTP